MSSKINVNSDSQHEIRTSINLPNILSSLRSGSISFISDSKWKETLNEQDHDNFILELREELMSRVMCEIQSKFLEHAQVKYVVECAYESLKQIICLNFLFHDPCNEQHHKFCSWHPDQEPEVCKQDSWSRGYIGMKKSDLVMINSQRKDTVLSDYKLIKVNEYPTNNYFGIEKPKDSLKKESVQELYSCAHYIDPQFSILNYPFTVTSPASSSSAMYENIIVNKMSSESQLPVRHSDVQFFKRVKKNERERLSIDANTKLTIFRARNLPTFNPTEEYKKLTLPPLRLPAASKVTKRASESIMPVSEKNRTNVKHFSKADVNLESTSSHKFK